MKRDIMTSARLVPTIVGIVFVCEALVMGILHVAGAPGLWDIVLDPLLLSILLAPILLLVLPRLAARGGAAPDGDGPATSPSSRWWIVAGIGLLGGLGVLVLAGLGASQGAFTRETIRAFQEHQLSEARSLAAGVEEIFEEVEQDLTFLALDPDIAGLTPDAQLELDAYLRTHADVLHSLTRADAAGDQILRSPASPDLHNIAHWPTFAAALGAGGAQVSEPEPCMIDEGVQVVGIAVPIGEKGRFTGVLYACVDLHKLWDKWLPSGEAGQFCWVIAGDGEILYDTTGRYTGRTWEQIEQEWHAAGRIGTDEEEAAAEALRARVQRGEEGTALYRNNNAGEGGGVEELMAFAPIRLGNELYGLAVATPLSRISGPMAAHARVTYALMAGMLLFLGISGYVGFLGTRARTRLLAEQSQAAERARSARALRESTERLSQAQRVARMGFLDWDLGTDEMYWSDQVYELCGVEREAQRPTIDRFLQIVHPEDARIVRLNLDLAIDGVNDYDLDHRLRRPDGTVVWVHAQAELVRDADGCPESLLGTVVDITERMEAEADASARADELEQQSVELAKSRRVALNLMEDAEKARECAEDLIERLSGTATEIKGLMDAATDGDLTRRFENPLLVHCWDVKQCGQEECPSYERVDSLRCWEVSGTFCRGEVQGKFAKKLKDCRQCEVYQAAHADPVTDLGETFNQMMTILHDRQASLEAALGDADSAREVAEAAREERREEEQKLRAITSSAQDAIIMMDHMGLVAFWNKAAERIFGWTEQEMMGERLHPVIVPAKYHEAHYAAFRGFQKTGQGGAIGQTVQLDARHKDGREIPIELSLSAFELDGQWCSIGMVRDVSERVENERAQARLRAAIEAATETIVITDTEGVILYANPAFERVTGYTCAEALGANPRVLNSGEHDKAFYEDLWGTITNGEVWQGHFINKKKDGTLYHEDATISPVKDEQGQIVNYVAVKRDVTRQQVLERQLLQAQKMESIGQLAAGIAHEINTPTQYVGDNTRFIRDSVEDLVKLADRHVALLASVKDGSVKPELVAELEQAIEELDLEFVKEEIPKAIEQTLDGVARVAEIVGAMKDFSHPGGDEKTPTDLNKAIQSTVTVCKNRWKYVADMEIDFADDLPLAPCLAGEFNQVILNVIVNAADAIGEIVGDSAADKGRIAVSTRRDGEWVEIRVSDTGGGIPKEIQQKVFDPFFTTKQVGKGTGQGLSICHDVIVDKHGGTIDFEVEPGIGTTFIIRLPIAEQKAAQQRGAA